MLRYRLQTIYTHYIPFPLEWEDEFTFQTFSLLCRYIEKEFLSTEKCFYIFVFSFVVTEQRTDTKPMKFTQYLKKKRTERRRYSSMFSGCMRPLQYVSKCGDTYKYRLYA